MMFGLKLYIRVAFRINKFLPYKALGDTCGKLCLWLGLLGFMVLTPVYGWGQVGEGLGSADDLGRTLFKSIQDPEFGWLRYTLANPEVYRLAAPEDTRDLSDEQVLASIRENVYPRIMQRSGQLRDMLNKQTVIIDQCTYLRTESFDINSSQNVLRRIQVFLNFENTTVRLEALGFEYRDRWYLTEIILPEDPAQLIDP